MVHPKPANAERAFAEENCCPVLTMLDHQCLRSQCQHFLGGSGQVGLSAQGFGFGIVDQQHVNQLQGFDQLLARAVDPVVHGIAAGQGDILHVPPYLRL